MENWGPKPFRFLNAWITHPGYKKYINDEWNKIKGWLVSKRLKLLKGPFREWNKLNIGHIDQHLKCIEEEIHELDKIVDTRTLTEAKF